MMVFDNFVFVHLPKTGGTFVEQVLKTLHCPSWIGQKIHGMQRRLGITIPFYPYKYREHRKHAECRFIPQKDQGKVIVSCVRNPYDLYISHYKFGWWKKHPQEFYASGSEIYKRSILEPAKVTFADWVHGMCDHGIWVMDRRTSCPGVDVGFAASEFAAYFCKESDLVLSQPTEAQMATEFERSKYNVQFLRMETLNEQLYQFLRERGYPEERVAFIRTKDKIFPGRQTRSASDSADKFFTPELKALVRQKERLLFALFPEYDI